MSAGGCKHLHRPLLSLSFPQARAHGSAEPRQFILPFLSLFSPRTCRRGPLALAAAKNYLR